MPSVSAVAITPQSQPYRRDDTLPAGYVEEEFFVACRSSAGAYRTVIHVRRPARAAKASGIVVVEPWHTGDLWPVYGSTEDYIARSGHTSVIVAAAPTAAMRLVKPRNPARYETVAMADGEGVEAQVLAQVGTLIRAGGLPGVKPRRMILSGYSGTGAVVRRYIAEQHAVARPGGKNLFDGYFPGQTSVGSAPAPIPDLEVPVVELQGESELIRTFERGAAQLGFRRPDGPNYRLYEVAGLSHLDTRRSGGSAAAWICNGEPRSDFPLRAVWSAALANLVRWVDRGVPAPTAPRIETTDGGRTILRDAYGNARGGLRTPELDVPLATYNVTSPRAASDPQTARCDMVGWRRPLPPDVLARLYPTPSAYAANVDRRLRELVRGRWLLAEDAAELRAEARRARDG